MSDLARGGIETTDEVAVGSVVDRRYVLRRLIAEGGMGMVFEAEQRFLRRTVALKLLPTRWASRDGHQQRLLREALALASVRHPGFVEVIDAGECDRHGPFVALEMLEGRPLDGILAARRQLPVETVVNVGLRLCEALAFAHARGVVHRDIKPTNVFISPNEIGEESVKILDLGIAAIEDASLQAVGARKLTMADELLGTPEYMAPEQIFAMAVDHRCDIYALAVTLFECLSGGVPYSGSYPQVLLKIGTAKTPPNVLAACPTAPAKLAGVIERALARNADDRYPTVADFGRALAAAGVEAGIDIEAPLQILREGVAGRRAEPSESPISLVEVVQARRPPPLPAAALAPPAPVRQRHFTRAPYVTPLVLVDAGGGVGEARSEDISAGGLLALTQRDYAAGEELNVRFALPGTGVVVVIRAAVRWARSSRGRTAVGLEFVAAPPAVVAAIERFVEVAATPGDALRAE